MPLSPSLADELDLEDEGGAAVLSVVEGSPADGVLRPGDVIIRLEDQPIESVEDFYATLREFKPGRRVTIEILRDGERRQVELRLAKRSE